MFTSGVAVAVEGNIDGYIFKGSQFMAELYQIGANYFPKTSFLQGAAQFRIGPSGKKPGGSRVAEDEEKETLERGLAAKSVLEKSLHKVACGRRPLRSWLDAAA